MQKATQNQWQKLADELKAQSKEICEMNGCTEDNHNCESYAYIAEDGSLIDVCASDYFQGWGSADEALHGGCAAIPLPWDGDGAELKDAVEDDCSM